MYYGWLNELWYVGGLALIVLIVGLIAGYPILFLLLGLLAYLSWHLVNLIRLQRWLKDRRDFQPPVTKGLWGKVFNEVYRLQMRNRKRKRQLTQNLKRFREAFSALPDATVALTVNNEIEWLNDAAQTLFGLRWPHDAGQRIANLVRHPAFVEFLATADYSKTVNLPSPVNGQVQLSAFIIPYGKQQHLLVARNVTRVQQLEQMRRDFVANVSHELRTPLTVVNGFLETLNEAADECPPQWARSLYLMKQQTTRMQNIVTDLLMLSRLEMEQQTHPRNIVRVPDMLATLLHDAQNLSGEREHHISLDADPRLWLRGNHDELQSAFSNLIFNAVHYTPERGTIDIRWFADDEGAHLQIKDTGEGIASYHLPRLTERFYRIDAGRSRKTGGTGLGLAIAKHVLNRHHAQLRVHSELSKGSIFTCDFPSTAIVHPAATESPD